MKKTKNYAMPYPEQDDYFNVEDFQDMMVSVDDLMKKLSDSGAQISSDAEHLYNQTKAQMDNIQKRMNAFTALRDGSTTGDAELKDIRVAYDGKEYGNAGEAVREQASDIHKALFGAGASIWSKVKAESTKYVAETKGICILNECFTAAGVVTKISRGTFAENESTLNLDRECSAYIVEFEKNPGTVYMPSAETIKIVSTTKIIFEANGNARCWIPVEKGQYLAVDSTATAYTSESNHVPYMLYDQANKTLECRGFGSTGSIEPVDPYSLALEYKLEYDMDDTGLVKQIDANREAAASLKEDIDGVFKKTYSRNLLKYNNLKQGFYLNDKGEVTANSLYAFIEDYLSVDENTYYTLSKYNKENRDYIGGANCIVCFYNSEKEFLSYKQIIDENLGKFITPLNCKYIRLSGLAEWFNDELLQLEKGTTPTNYVEYEMKITLSKEAVPDSVESKTVVNHLIVKKDGTGNFIKIQDAINSINDSSKNNRYIIHVYEGEYNLGEDFTESDISNPSFSGIFVPDFVTIKGEGNRDNIILFVELTEYNEKISALNLSNTSELEGITVRGTRTRYCVHDDFAKNNISYKRSVKNCKFIAIDTYYNTCYGSGCKEGADWKFENCIFDASQCNDSDGKIAFLNHNNVNWRYTSVIKFINCKFIGNYVANKNAPITLRTLNNNANNMETNVSLYGCDIGGGIVLKEESKDAYGSGILFKINGFANKNLEYSIVNTDGKDYSGNVNLIN